MSAQINMDSFGQFLESSEDDFHMQKTRSIHDSPDNHSHSQLKDANIAAVQTLIDRHPEITLGQLINHSIDNKHQFADIIDFANKHEFDETMPLHSLLMVYGQYAK